MGGGAASQLVAQILNGLSFGMLLFLVSSGLTVIFGLMRVLSLVHGSLYLFGGYLAFTVQRATGKFHLALIVAVLGCSLLAWVIERLLHRQLYVGLQLNQVLLTMGLAFVIGDFVLWYWGGNPQTVTPPEILRGSLSLGFGIVYPRYRLLIIGIGLAIAALFHLVWDRTRLGAILRAGVDDAEMLRGLGVRIGIVFTAVFAGGGALAAFAGTLGGPFLGVYPGLDFEVILLSVVIVVVGGVGSLTGAFLGSIVIGLLDAFSKAYFPVFSYFAMFGPMILILAFKPTGLFGADRT
ncbi:MAG: branched-chain amino acid ABC transporter permease [Candidatus Tectomicrobia bacterium]|uniref:Branched-chain amino acid ABC transporter permease n=1 Tax=Tectimicrobiota bacterium TaxID=2528274 RepID=A0A932GRL2_UNCTE|nr:branched-chain amino acid ABC transporter permease [Candidatus Tectomicrobia bacterium]